MSHWGKLAALLSAAAVFLMPAASSAKHTIDSTLYTTFIPQETAVSLQVCGQLPGSSGCYDGATMSPFEKACAVLMSEPKTKGETITRHIYVLDKRASAKSPVTLYIYTRTDTLTTTFDTVNVTLLNTLNLGIVGGPTSHCSMAADKNYLFAGTDADGHLVRVGKKDYSLFTFNDFGGGVNSITSDGRGYIAVNAGIAFIISDGNTVQDGGPSGYMIGTENAYDIQ